MAGSRPARTRGRPAPRRLLGEERRRRIAEYVRAHGSATVGELASRFGVSTVTLRTDLAALARGGALARSHGGALAPAQDPVPETPLRERLALHHDEKLRIAAAAAATLRDGETLILDSGSTTAAMAELVPGLGLRSLTVVTNALNIAMALSEAPGVRVLMLGGMLRPLSHSLVGPDAGKMLSRLDADRLFLGADGIDPEAGVTTTDPMEAQLNACMIEAARETVVLADGSKFGRRGLSAIAPVERVARIVTDDGAPAAMVAAFRARGIEVVQA